VHLAGIGRCLFELRHQRLQSCRDLFTKLGRGLKLAPVAPRSVVGEALGESRCFRIPLARLEKHEDRVPPALGFLELLLHHELAGDRGGPSPAGDNHDHDVR
jgi:hypothetical protein